MIASTLALLLIAVASITPASAQQQDVSALCGPCGGRIGAEIGCEEGLICERPDTLGGASGICVQATKGSAACVNGSAVATGDDSATDDASAAETIASTQAAAVTTSSAAAVAVSSSAVTSVVSKPAAASSSTTTTSVKSAATTLMGVTMAAAFAAVFFV
ncbi:hypothetical protein BJ741DRAFT_606783 [Chytriomyces cf. hyalinus JEL632]|nr:hypothetical protein BJ741DRAFT_606783 [Chytriomyces cf. hyalinus JEL632]